MSTIKLKDVEIIKKLIDYTEDIVHYRTEEVLQKKLRTKNEKCMETEP